MTEPDSAGAIWGCRHFVDPTTADRMAQLVVRAREEVAVKRLAISFPGPMLTPPELVEALAAADARRAERAVESAQLPPVVSPAAPAAPADMADVIAALVAIVAGGGQPRRVFNNLLANTQAMAYEEGFRKPTHPVPPELAALERLGMLVERLLPGTALAVHPAIDILINRLRKEQLWTPVAARMLAAPGVIAALLHASHGADDPNHPIVVSLPKGVALDALAANGLIIATGDGVLLGQRGTWLVATLEWVGVALAAETPDPEMRFSVPVVAPKIGPVLTSSIGIRVLTALDQRTAHDITADDISHRLEIPRAKVDAVLDAARREGLVDEYTLESCGKRVLRILRMTVATAPEVSGGALEVLAADAICRRLLDAIRDQSVDKPWTLTELSSQLGVKNHHRALINCRLITQVTSRPATFQATSLAHALLDQVEATCDALARDIDPSQGFIRMVRCLSGAEEGHSARPGIGLYLLHMLATTEMVVAHAVPDTLGIWVKTSRLLDPAAGEGPTFLADRDAQSQLRLLRDCGLAELVAGAETMTYVAVPAAARWFHQTLEVVPLDQLIRILGVLATGSTAAFAYQLAQGRLDLVNASGLVELTKWQLDRISSVLTDAGLASAFHTGIRWRITPTATLVTFVDCVDELASAVADRMKPVHDESALIELVGSPTRLSILRFVRDAAMRGESVTSRQVAEGVHLSLAQAQSQLRTLSGPGLLRKTWDSRNRQILFRIEGRASGLVDLALSGSGPSPHEPELL